GCSTRRSTWTTTVLVILAETTVPSRRLIRCRISCLRARVAGLAFFLSNHGEQPRQIATRLFVVARIFHLIGPQLQAEAKQLLAHLAFLDAQVGRRHLSDFVKLQ